MNNAAATEPVSGPKTPRDTFLGRCKACKKPSRLVAPVAEKRVAHMGYGRTETRYFRQLPTGGKIEGYDRFFLRCDCGTNRQTEFQLLRGRVSEHKCGAKCMNSTGPSCECSCGGKNHGMNHTAIILSDPVAS